jgi:hypothetical protein
VVELHGRGGLEGVNMSAPPLEVIRRLRVERGLPATDTDVALALLSARYTSREIVAMFEAQKSERPQ